VGRIAARRVEMRETHVDISGENSDGEKRAIIVGFGRVGRLVAEMMLEHKQPFVAVDSNIDTVARGRHDGFPTIFGDVSRPQLLENFDLERVSALIMTMDDPVSVVQLTRRVREAHPDLTIVARARDPEHAAALYRAGATDAVPETVESSLQLSEAVLVDIGVPMGPVIASIHEKRAELRDAIMKLGEMERLPELPREKLRKS